MFKAIISLQRGYGNGNLLNDIFASIRKRERERNIQTYIKRKKKGERERERESAADVLEY